MNFRDSIRVGLAVSALWVASACSSGRVEVEAPYEQAIAEEQPGRVYLTLSDGEELSLRSPVVRGDTVIGTTLNPRTNRYSDTVRVAIVDVDLIERDGDTSRTEYIAGGAAVVAGVVLFVVSAKEPY